MKEATPLFLCWSCIAVQVDTLQATGGRERGREGGGRKEEGVRREEGGRRERWRDGGREGGREGG